MLKVEKSEIERLKVLSALVAIFPNGAVTPAMIAAYHQVLAGVPTADLKRAIAWCVLNRTFFPEPKELFDAVRESDPAQRAPTAGEAWEEVSDAFITIGYMRTPTFSHALVHKAVKAMGGWHALCMCDDPPGVVRGQFIRLYNELAERAAQDDRAAAVKALAENDAVWQAVGSLAGKLALPGSKDEDES